jgi:hypothetical protein
MGRVAAVEIRDKRDAYIVAELKKEGVLCVAQDELPRYAKNGVKTIYVRSLLSEISLEFAKSLIEGSVLFGRGVSDEVLAILEQNGSST